MVGDSADVVSAGDMREGMRGTPRSPIIAIGAWGLAEKCGTGPGEMQQRCGRDAGGVRGGRGRGAERFNGDADGHT
jgi:hypothetical protein